MQSAIAFSRAAASPLAEFLRGAGYYLRGVGMVRHGRVLLLILLPFAIALVLYAVAGVALLVYGGAVPDAILAPGAWWRTVLRALVWALLWLAFAVLCALARHRAGTGPAPVPYDSPRGEAIVTELLDTYGVRVALR